MTYREQKPEIKINKELSHTILGVDLRTLFRIFLYLNGDTIFQAHCEF
jgi:hypothetical protein